MNVQVRINPGYLCRNHTLGQPVQPSLRLPLHHIRSPDLDASVHTGDGDCDHCIFRDEDFFELRTMNVGDGEGQREYGVFERTRGSIWFSLGKRVQMVRNTDVRSMNGAGGYLGSNVVNIPELEVHEGRVKHSQSHCFSTNRIQKL